MSLLKANLQLVGKDELPIKLADFENLWTTFFDLYDTLESFGSHLTKVSKLWLSI